MSELVLVTFEWLPEFPRGYVRDIRIRWAMEEAGLTYRVKGVPFPDKSPDHFAFQPFGQVPWLVSDGIPVFESGAILLHLGERHPELMPVKPRERAQVQEWLFAALNSVEMATVPWFIFKTSGDTAESPGRQRIDAFFDSRLQVMDKLLSQRVWLSDSFSIADIAMAEVLRLVHRFDGLEGYPACRDYLARAMARPAFVKALADQLAYFAAADDQRQTR